MHSTLMSRRHKHSFSPVKTQTPHPPRTNIFTRFKIQDDKIGKDTLAAWACIRLDRLRSGYRFVHLRDGAGVESKGRLLVGIQKTVI